MKENQVILVSIEELLKQSFDIPDYQRGYRWTPQQVEDLLNDIWEFCNSGIGGIYCIQPLVVRGIPRKGVISEIKELFSNDSSPSLSVIEEKLKVDRWEVIDGQQRLTTINIILAYLDSVRYNLSYSTRKESAAFLQNIKFKEQSDSDSNIDFFHMHQAYKTVKEWFESHVSDEYGVNMFRTTLLKRVQFIWYETNDDKPIKVFTRLNIGKISLTDSELIKALFLNSNHYAKSRELTSKQLEIASDWDDIEYALQNEQMWLFIHNTGYDNPTHIDYIFEIMRNQDKLGLRKLLCADESIKPLCYLSNELTQDKESRDWWNRNIGHDEHQTFRYFYKYFEESKKSLEKDNKTIDSKWMFEAWQEIKEYYQIFREWYDDLQLYHYIGFLVLQGQSIYSLLSLWNIHDNKAGFISELTKLIIGTIKNCRNLDAVYEVTSKKKTECRPLLILHNIETIINQNAELVNSKKYEAGTFYKFPFHLFKKEATKGRRYGWEIEHIASNAGDIEDAKNKKMYLASARAGVSDTLKAEIDAFNVDNDTEDNNGWTTLKDKICKELQEDTSFWTENTKNQIWNFTLLDSGTNQEYHNCVFPFKRMCVISKERGKQTIAYRNENGEVAFMEKNGIAFVPPCTRNVFTKAYTKSPKTLSSWGEEDAKRYKIDIEQTLSAFLYPEYNEAIRLLPDNKMRILKGMENEHTISAIINHLLHQQTEDGIKKFRNIQEAMLYLSKEDISIELLKTEVAPIKTR